MEFENNSNRENLLSIDFDQYQRYRRTADLVLQIKKKNNIRKLRIIDVGASLEENLSKFLPDDEIFFLDRDYRNRAPKGCNFIAGDAAHLGLADRSFDIATSVDVYEHIPPAEREKYIRELYRVGRLGCIFGAPFDTMNVCLLERLSNEFYKIIHNKEHIWLSEHIKYGLPELEHTREISKSLTENMYTFPNGYLPRWAKLIQLHFAAHHEFTAESMKLICRFYNENFYSEDNREPCYRYFFVLLREPCEFVFTVNNKREMSIESLESALDRMINNLNFAFQMRLKQEYLSLQQEHELLRHRHEALGRRHESLRQDYSGLQERSDQLSKCYHELQQTKAVLLAKRMDNIPFIKSFLLKAYQLLSWIFPALK